MLELFRRLQLRLCVNGGVERLLVDRRRTAKLADRHLRILRLDRADHVLGGELVAVELVGIEPDAHGVLRAVDVHAAHAVDTAERILQVGNDVIGNVLLVHAAVGGDEGHHHQRGIAGFRHRHALGLHRLRQPFDGRLQLVLHLLHRLVRIGAGLKGQRDRRPAGIGAL